MQEINNSVMSHTCILENRIKLTLSGVKDVGSFDEQNVIVETQLGRLTVRGENLRIGSLSTELGDTVIEGDIMSLIYSDTTRQAGSGFFSKVFR